MKISVLVPVFNVEAYLSACIESVLCQTYRNFELILVDDGSTDGSGAIADQYAARAPQQIKSLHTENRGALQTRATAIGEATGEVLVFLDSDDCLRGDALARIAACFEQTLCDMALFNAGPAQDFATLSLTHSLDPGKFFDEASKEELYKALIRGDIPNSICLKAVRATCAHVPTHILQHVIPNGEDLLLSAYFMADCKKVVYINEGLYCYRVREGSAVHTVGLQRLESVKTVHTELAQCLETWHLVGLRPLHNARKVKGWVSHLLLLMANRQTMSGAEWKKQKTSMAEDPYFLEAYASMDRASLSRSYALLADCLYKQQYFLISLLYVGIRVIRKIKRVK